MLARTGKGKSKRKSPTMGQFRSGSNGQLQAKDPGLKPDDSTGHIQGAEAPCSLRKGNGNSKGNSKITAKATATAKEQKQQQKQRQRQRQKQIPFGNDKQKNGNGNDIISIYRLILRGGA